MHKKGWDYAVSDVLGLIMVLMIVSTAIGSTLVWGIPYIDQRKATSQLDNVHNQFLFFNSVIDDITRQGAGSNFEEFKIAIESGEISFSNDRTCFIVIYSLSEFEGEYNLFVKGLEDDTADTIKIINWGSKDIEYEQIIWYDEDPPLTMPETMPIPGGAEGEIDFDLLGKPISDIMLIELYDKDDNLVAKIFRFKPGALEYKKYSSAGLYSTRIENNAVFYINPRYSVINKFPVVYEPVVLDEFGTIHLTLHFVHLTWAGSSGGSGGGDYIFSGEVTLHELFDGYQSVNDMKLGIGIDEKGIDGKYSDEWINFYSGTYSLEQEEQEKVVYLTTKDDVKITVLCSIVNIDLEGIE